MARGKELIVDQDARWSGKRVSKKNWECDCGQSTLGCKTGTLTLKRKLAPFGASKECIMVLSCAATAIIRFFGSERSMIQSIFRQNKAKCNHLFCWRQSRKMKWYSSWLRSECILMWDGENFGHLILMVSNISKNLFQNLCLPIIKITIWPKKKKI